MVLVGLTGGLASGKSTIASMFHDLGAWIIDADQLARDVVQPGKAAWRDIKEHFGRKVLNTDGTINRAALAEMVFHHPAQLKRLQHFIHPRVAREQARLAGAIRQQDSDAVIVYDAALLIEAGAHRRMDHVIVVTADQASQITRACRRSGFSKAQALRRIRRQLPLRQKLQYADTVLDGTWPRSRLRRIVQALYRTYQEEARQKPRPASNVSTAVS
ncbi:MAG: dephospho-CoA kinase [Nitrospirales bacterium]